MLFVLHSRNIAALIPGYGYLSFLLNFFCLFHQHRRVFFYEYCETDDTGLGKDLLVSQNITPVALTFRRLTSPLVDVPHR